MWTVDRYILENDFSSALEGIEEFNFSHAQQISEGLENQRKIMLNDPAYKYWNPDFLNNYANQVKELRIKS
jgi:hypothetical protein